MYFIYLTPIPIFKTNQYQYADKYKDKCKYIVLLLLLLL